MQIRDSEQQFRTQKGKTCPKIRLNVQLRRQAVLAVRIMARLTTRIRPDVVAIFVECATDNHTRTVANVRMYFNKFNGSLGQNGCLQFIFDHKGIFLIPLEDRDEDEIQLELIEAGAEDFTTEDGMMTVFTGMTEFGNVQKALQDLSIEPKEAGLQRIPTVTKAMGEKHVSTFLKLIDALEDLDDVQNVYHNAEIDEAVLEAAMS